MATTKGGAPQTRLRPSRRTIQPMEERQLGDTESVLETLGGKAARVELHRRDGADFAYVDTVSGDAVTLPAIKEAYGAGKYEARIYGADSPTPTVVAFNIAAASVTKKDDETGPLVTILGKVLERLERIERAPRHDASSDVMAKVLEKVLTPPQRDPLLETLIAGLLSQKKEGVDTIALMKLLQDERNAGIDLGKQMAENPQPDSMREVAGVIRDVGVPLANAVGERMRQEKLHTTVFSPKRLLTFSSSATSLPDSSPRTS